MEKIDQYITKIEIDSIIETTINSSDFKILSTSVSPVGAATGFLGTHLQLKIVVLVQNEEKVLSYFVKLLPDDAHAQHYEKSNGIFQKENDAYELLRKLPLASDVTARVYLLKHPSFVFENLSEGKFAPLPSRQTLTYENVVNVLRSLAKLHAGSLIYEETEGKSLLEDHLRCFREIYWNPNCSKSNRKTFDAAIKSVLFCFDYFKCDSGLKEIATKFCWKATELAKRSSKYRNTFNHGDLWSTNFLINDKGVCKFVDFQIVRYCPPAHDVMCFIHLNTSREFRAKHMEELKQMYYDELKRNCTSAKIRLTQILPYEEFLESCKEQQVMAVILTSIYFPIILMSDEMAKKVSSDGDFSVKAFFEDKSLLLDLDGGDENYRKRIADSTADFRELCETQLAGNNLL